MCVCKKCVISRKKNTTFEFYHKLFLDYRNSTVELVNATSPIGNYQYICVCRLQIVSLRGPYYRAAGYLIAFRTYNNNTNCLKASSHRLVRCGPKTLLRGHKSFSRLRDRKETNPDGFRPINIYIDRILFIYGTCGRQEFSSFLELWSNSSDVPRSYPVITVY